MTDKNKVFSMIGLATRARKVVSGEFSTEKSVKSGRSHMVIVSEEASDNTKKKMKNMTAFYETPLYVYGSKDDLGHCIGKEYRSMVAVLQPGFAKSVMKQLDNRPTTE